MVALEGFGGQRAGGAVTRWRAGRSDGGVVAVSGGLDASGGGVGRMLPLAPPMAADIIAGAMSIFDRFSRRAPDHDPRAEGTDVERLAGSLAISVLAVEDPFVSEASSHSSSEAYKRGDERLVAFDVRIRNTASGGEPRSVSGSKFHLYDDADYVTESIGRDARARTPLLVETYVAPGSAVRGWVTFALSWDRRPARLQFFAGYLTPEVAVFALPMCDAAEQARRRDELVRAKERAEAARAREAQEREARAVEAKFAALEAQRAHEERVRVLEERARAARSAIAEAEAERARFAQQQRPPEPWRDDDDDEDPGAA